MVVGMFGDYSLDRDVHRLLDLIAQAELQGWWYSTQGLTYRFYHPQGMCEFRTLDEIEAALSDDKPDWYAREAAKIVPAA